MGQSQPALEQLLERARGGEQAALTELIRFCDKYVRHEVKLHLNGAVRPLLDVEDVAQNVWLIVLVRWQHGGFATAQQLLAFLRGAAENGVRAAHHRYLDTQARDLRRERPLDEASAEPLTREDPNAGVLARDEWEWLLACLPDPIQGVMDLLHQGHSTKEIAQAVGASQRTIQRLVLQGIHTLQEHFR